MTEYIFELPDKPAKVVRDGWNVRIEWDFKQREEIVRCRDCEYYDDYTGCCTRRDNIAPMAATPNDFCAWGIRK